MRFEDIGLVADRSAEERYHSRAADVESVSGETVWEVGFRRGVWEVRTQTRTVLTYTPTEFRLHAGLDAYEGGRRVLSRNWQREIPRDHV